MGNPLILDIGGGELLVILLFVLLFFGSKGVPELARTMGRALRQFRDASAEVQREIEKGASDVKRGFEEQRKTFRIEPPEHLVAAEQAAKEEPVAAPTADQAVGNDAAEAESPVPAMKGGE